MASNPKCGQEALERKMFAALAWLYESGLLDRALREMGEDSVPINELIPGYDDEDEDEDDDEDA